MDAYSIPSNTLIIQRAQIKLVRGHTHVHPYNLESYSLYSTAANFWTLQSINCDFFYIKVLTKNQLSTFFFSDIFLQLPPELNPDWGVPSSHLCHEKPTTKELTLTICARATSSQNNSSKTWHKEEKQENLKEPVGSPSRPSLGHCWVFSPLEPQLRSTGEGNTLIRHHCLWC